MLFERNWPVYRVTVDGRLLDCNDACARIFGHTSASEMLEHTVLDSYPDPGLAMSFCQTEGAWDSTNFEHCLQRNDGSPLWVLENATLVKSGEGEISQIEGSILISPIAGRRK